MKHLGLAFLVMATPLFAASSLPEPDAHFPQADMNEVHLGRLLFYDPVLSGNQNVSCASCHHPRFGTSDGLALGLGDGGIGLGPDRRADPGNLPEQRIPRNAPGLFNLGADEFTTMFHDGRLEADPDKPGGIRTPLGADMTAGFDSVLSAQAMFPVLSPDEMAGHYSENDVSKAVRLGLLTGPGGAWDIIASRVSAIPEYRSAFDQVIGTGEPIEFTDIANVIADFIAFEWRADNSPFDRYLREGSSLSDDAMAGMALFYGSAGCADCHSGLFQTDHRFHAIAMPQIGPGKAARFEDHHRDEGRLRVTGNPDDRFAFRTPSLRNLSLTAPYGHSGAYQTLEAVIRHHMNPVRELSGYSLSVDLPDLPGQRDMAIMSDPAEVDAIARAAELPPMQLSDAELAQLIAFLQMLEDPLGRNGRLGVPDSVPSGLPVDQ